MIKPARTSRSGRIRRESTVRLAFVLPLLVVAGCSFEDDLGSPGGRHAATDSMQIQIGERSLGPVQRRMAGPLAWTAVEIATIGATESGKGNATFHRVPAGGMAGDRSGNLWILDGSSSRLLLFDRDGGLIRAAGSRGEGPGEIGHGRSLAVGSGDTVWVVDLQPSRITGFPADGGTPRIVPLPPIRGRPGGRFAVHDGRLIIGYPVPQSWSLRISGTGPLFKEARDRLANVLDPSGHVLVSWDGIRIDTIVNVPQQRSPVDTVRRQTSAGTELRLSSAASTPAPEIRWALLSNGNLAVVDTERYELRIVSIEGTELVRVSPVDTAGAVVGDVLVDHADRIWVAVRDEHGEHRRIDVYDANGVALGTIIGLDMPTAFLGDALAVYRRRHPVLGTEMAVVARIVEN